MSDTSLASVATNIFTAPREAFPAIKERPRAWLPLLLLIASVCGVLALYGSSVDVGWVVEQQLDASSRELTSEQREAAIAASSRMTPTVYAAILAVGGAIAMLLVVALLALYYTGVSAFTHDGIKYKHWFAFAAWCALPGLFSALASIVNLSVVDARFLLQDLVNPLSFVSLLSIDPKGLSAPQRMLLGRDLTSLWTIALGVIGYMVWTKRPLYFAAAVILAPYLLLAALAAF